MVDWWCFMNLFTWDEIKNHGGCNSFNQTLPGLDNNVINLVRNQGCPAWFLEKHPWAWWFFGRFLSLWSWNLAVSLKQKIQKNCLLKVLSFLQLTVFQPHQTPMTWFQGNCSSWMVGSSCGALCRGLGPKMHWIIGKGVLDARNRSLSTSIGMCDFILQTWQQCSGRSCEFPQDDEYFSDAKAKQSTTSGSRSAVCDDVWWFLVRFFGCLLAAESMIPKKHRL